MQRFHLKKPCPTLWRTLWAGTHWLQNNPAWLLWERGKPSEVDVLSAQHKTPQRYGKELSHHVTPGLNHNKRSHFSSQTLLEALHSPTNAARGLGMNSRTAWFKLCRRRLLVKGTSSPCPKTAFPVCLCWMFHLCVHVCFITSLLSQPSTPKALSLTMSLGM